MALADLLASIRGRESVGTAQKLGISPYSLPPTANYDYPNSHASGAYQIQPGTWRDWTAKFGIGQQYSEAYQAPPAVQDAVAARAAQTYGPNATYTWGASAPPGGYSTDTTGGLGNGVTNLPNVPDYSGAFNDPNVTHPTPEFLGPNSGLTGGSFGDNPPGSLDVSGSTVGDLTAGGGLNLNPSTGGPNLSSDLTTTFDPSTGNAGSNPGSYSQSTGLTNPITGAADLGGNDAGWWNTLSQIIVNDLTRFGLVLFALVLIGAAVFAMARNDVMRTASKLKSAVTE